MADGEGGVGPASDEGGVGPASDDDVAQADEIVTFWETARVRARLGRIAVVTGVGAESVLPPPAWSFGDSPELADELLALVLSGQKRATATSAAELAAAGEPVPQVGDLSIVLDGAGHPRALIRTTEVRVARFGDVDEEFAAREGEDDGTLESWRREHAKYYRRVLEGTGVEFGEDLEVVLETFEVLYPGVPAQGG